MNSIAAFALMVAIMIQQHVILLASQFSSHVAIFIHDNKKHYYGLNLPFLFGMYKNEISIHSKYKVESTTELTILNLLARLWY